MIFIAVMVMLLKLRRDGLDVGALCAPVRAKSREDSATRVCNFGAAGGAAGMHASGSRCPALR
jgi:hypothetical protein